ncbi:MAG: biopolymer transporter ExbD [Candidatus Binatia bacterium]
MAGEEILLREEDRVGDERAATAAIEWEESLPASRIRRRKRRFDDPLVNLTSMVDVLSVLMFFLLTIYTGGGYLTVLPAGLTLPNSTVTASLTRNLEVAVLSDKILVEREPVADDPRVFAENDDLLLPALQAALAAKAPPPPVVPAAEGQVQTVGPEIRVTIAADRTVPFRLLKKIMYTVDQAGFRRQSLAVKSVEG